MKNNDYFPQIRSIIKIQNYKITILFDNSEIRIIDIKEFLKLFPKAEKINNQILSEEHWNTIKLDSSTLYFPNILDGYHIDTFSIYDFSTPINLTSEKLKKLDNIEV